MRSVHEKEDGKEECPLKVGVDRRMGIFCLVIDLTTHVYTKTIYN